MRYTGQWLELFQDLTLDECLETVGQNPMFHPVLALLGVQGITLEVTAETMPVTVTVQSHLMGLPAIVRNLEEDFAGVVVLAPA